jgi:hypothetical protein
MKPTTQMSAETLDVRLLFSRKSTGEDLGAFSENASYRHFQQSPAKRKLKNPGFHHSVRI